jgi:hypothetical protein
VYAGLFKPLRSGGLGARRARGACRVCGCLNPPPGDCGVPWPAVAPGPCPPCAGGAGGCFCGWCCVVGLLCCRACCGRPAGAPLEGCFVLLLACCGCPGACWWVWVVCVCGAVGVGLRRARGWLVLVCGLLGLVVWCCGGSMLLPSWCHGFGRGRAYKGSRRACFPWGRAGPGWAAGARAAAG